MAEKKSSAKRQTAIATALCRVWWLPLLDAKQFTQRQKPHTHIFLCNLHCFEPSQGCCEQSLYRAQGHFCWYLPCFLRFLAAHNDAPPSIEFFVRHS